MFTIKHQSSRSAMLKGETIHSQRIKAGLAEARRRGIQLGNPQIDELNARKQSRAESFALSIKPVIARIRKDGYTTLRDLRDEMNRRNVPTARGGQWHLATVQRLIKRIEESETE